MAQYRDKKLLQQMAIVLKQLRESKEVIQDDVFDETGIHIGRIETAKANLTVSTLSKLCKYYNISISEFFHLVDSVSGKKIQ